jgi:BlaI family transcriptional regulator, penicillinase repressor
MRRGLHTSLLSATNGSTTMRSDISKETRLGELEHLVMNFVWNNPDCTAEECRQAASAQRTLRESTIRTVLTRLEQKGLVTHDLDGRSYRYRAAAPRGSFAANAVRRIIEQFCGGSVEQLLVGMVDNSVVDHRTLEKVARRSGSARGRK